MASPQSKIKVLVSSHQDSTNPRIDSGSLWMLKVEALMESRIPDFFHLGACFRSMTETHFSQLGCGRLQDLNEMFEGDLESF